MSRTPFHRPARRKGPPPGGGEIELQEPPELPEPQPAGLRMLATLLPSALMGGGMMILFLPSLAGGGSGGGGGGGGGLGAGVGVIGMGLMAVGMAGMAGGQLLTGGGDRKQQATGDRRDYQRFLAQVRRRVREQADLQRQALAWAHPAPDALWSLAMTTRLWERRPSHSDFAEVRIGTGAQRMATRLSVPQTKPVEDLDPVSAKALRRFVRAYSHLADQPVPLFLRGFGIVQVSGERPEVLDLVRAVLAQLAVLHGPDDLRLAVCVDEARRPDWDWVKWLPHVQHPTRQDATGAARAVVTGADELQQLLGDDLNGRVRFDPGATPTREEPYLVVVNDGGRLGPHHRLLAAGYRNTLLLDLDGVGGQFDVPHLRLALTDGRIERLSVDRLGAVVRTELAVADGLSAARAAAVARRLARFEVASGDSVDVPAEESLTVDRDLPSLLGVTDLADFDPAAVWAARAPGDELRVPIGTAADGSPLVVDIKESAQGGMGPHGLLIGATGSGKSELLRTLVLGLAMTHSSETLNLVLVDFKGGATFAGLDALSHVSAVITNLAEEATLVARMREAIHGELVRRQELLRATGNHASRRDYEQARRRGAALDPLPTLFVVVDEFSELISSHPEFIELFVMIGRLGRSLGVHLLLASQRLDEGRIGQLEGHLSYRIGLRTFSAMESRAVIGVPDAYELPSAPGNGYLRSDVSTIVRFRAAYVSGAPPRRARRVQQDVIAGQVMLFGTSPADSPTPEVPADSPTPETPAADAPGHVTSEDVAPDPAASVLSAALDRLAGNGPPAHVVWLPPLEEAPSLDRVLPPLVPDPELGLRPVDRTAGTRLAVPLGVVDRPFEQRRDLLMADLSGVGGHVGVAGGPQSGKSTLLRTLVCALSLTHAPTEVQFLCLDFGGGSLAALSRLPHVGAVTGRLDPDRVGRTVAELTALLTDRERRFADLGLPGMAAYREAGAAGRLAPGESTADVFLVVDGWSTLRQDFEDAELALRQLAVRGLNFGLHLVIAANRWADLHHSMRDQIGTRLELRLGDHVDSAVDIRLAATVPAQPGRGLTGDKLHFLAALPRIDGGGAGDLDAGTQALVEAVDECWEGTRAMGVRTLPAELPVAQLPAPSGLRVALAIEESRLEPVWHDFAETPHLTVLGDTESGKTNLLRLVLRAITTTTTPDDARVLVVDWRRQLFDEVPEGRRLGYAVSSDTTAAAVRDALHGLGTRVPGPTITPEQLRRRDWWSGPELFVVVDDFDLIAGHDNPLAPLVPLLPQAGDIGLHVVLARAAAGSMRLGSDPFLRRLQELNTPDVVLSCPRDEGSLLGGARARVLPPGRAQLCTRRGSRLVQTGLVPPLEDGEGRGPGLARSMGTA